MTASHTHSWTASLALAATACVAAGCGASRTYLRVTSHPEGATVYVNGEARGQTDVTRLEVDLLEDGYATVRVEKDGYQTAGVTVCEDSPGHLAFFLEKSPSNDELQASLQNLQRLLDQVYNRIEVGSGQDHREAPRQSP